MRAGKAYLRKVEVVGPQRRRGKKREKEEYEHQSKRKRKGKGDPVAGAETLLQPMERITVEQVGSSWRNHGLWVTHGGTALPWKTVAYERTHTGAGGKCEDEGVMKSTCGQTTILSPQCLRRLSVRSWQRRNKVGPGKKGEVRMKCCIIIIILS